MAVSKKISVQSVLDGTLLHNDIEIAPFEVISVDEKIALELVATKFCKLVKVKEV
ncbi:MAG: hypothetical protein ACRCX7_11050 [Cetobacterium sp.]|uniref:hypothetical protein n=1 Tax=Cetobacterium sp. TaxID=2071632 RepID=UPI003F3CE1D8